MNVYIILDVFLKILNLGITEVLTHDKHFTQEGFVVIFNGNR